MLPLSEIVVEGDDYRFTTDEWSRYTGRQIIVGSLIVAGAALMVFGWSWGMAGISEAIIETSQGPVLQFGTAGPGAIFGPGLSAIGVSAISVGVGLWPRPWRYGQPIEEADSR